MKHFILAVAFGLVTFSAVSQTVPFPANWGNTNQLENWGYTNDGTSWDTSPFLPFFYNGLHMRIMPPNGVTYTQLPRAGTWANANPGTKYPLVLFFQGNGEVGTDNNKQLIHSGSNFKTAIQAGTFPGFAFYPQSISVAQAKQILDYLVTILPIDINRIYVHGLSGGANLVCDFTIAYPTTVAAAFPMSGTRAQLETETFMYTPFRQSQGSLDINPTPAFSQGVVDYFTNNGGHLEYFLLQGVGHGTWDYMYALPDFFSWFLSHKKNEILVRYNRNLICPEATISVDMGFTPGFAGYQWMKDGVVISGATNYKYVATVYGTYTGRILNGGVWSDWATPVIVGQKGTTNTPPIVTSGLKSIVLPAPDGSTTTDLMLPTGYQSYTWKNVGTGATVSSGQIFTGAPVGTYTASANEFNGCATIPSPSFNVISAVGPNSPDAINDFLGYATSVTQVVLGWADKPSPNFNETGFEIYRSQTGPTGQYSLIAITAPDVVGYTDSNLTPNTTYSYLIRPVNSFSAAPVSSVVSVLTQVDNIPPTAPSNLVTTGGTSVSSALTWTGSTDNVGVFRYDVYKNNVKVLSTSLTNAVVYNLTPGTVYDFTVKARDMTGNSSTPSNLVTLNASSSGLQYQYYETATTLSALPDFTKMVPVSTGFTPNVDVTVRRTGVTTNYAFYWSGMINIPVAGSYTFITNSDDGSKLYIGGYGESFKVVDNDGGHGVQDKSGTKVFAAAGQYPIVITYFQGGGGAGMGIFWQNTANGIVSRTAIPNSAFSNIGPLGGIAPSAPSALIATVASFNQINLAWTDNSNNESGFRIYRAAANAGPYVPVATVAPNTTTYHDTQLTAATTYYYRVTSYGNFGESAPQTGVMRGLTYAYYEAGSMTSLSQIASLSPVKTGTSSIFDITLRDRSENMALSWTGKINITVANTYTFYASSDDGSTLSIDNTQVVSNDTDGAQKEKSGAIVLAVGWHDINVKWRKHVSTSSRLTISYSSSKIGKSVINASNSAALLFSTEVNAKTSVLPPVPLTPTNVVATNPMPTTIKLTWTDNATDETGYEILRSYKTNANYVNFQALPANSTTFSDDGLFSNGKYFYKVQAIGAAGSSTSAEVSMTTANNPPVLSQLQDLVVKFGTTYDLNLYSSDVDGDPITLTATGLPAFATLTDYHDGTGLIHFAPSSSQLGQYPIIVTAMDNHSGVSSGHFNLTVTDKAAPVILPITSPTLNEAQSTNLQLQATSDVDTSSIVWTFTGLPGFATPVTNGGTCSIAIAPTYIDAGTYPVTVTVTDALSSTSKTFIITVNEVDPNTMVAVNMVNSTSAAAPWNNMSNVSLSNILDSNGNATGNSIALSASTWTSFNQGAVTGNNSGVFPDNVIKDYYYFGFNGAPNTVNMTVSGLDITKKYYFTFFGSSAFTNQGDNGSTIYQIGTTAVSLRVQNNSNNVAMIPSVAPAANGTVTITMSKDTGAPIGYINAMTYTAVYQDGTVPAAARNASAALVGNNVVVSWIDAAFNEDGYDVYRSNSATGPFVKLDDNSLAENATSFVDSSAVSGTSYYYEVQAFNAFGVSAYSNVASTVLPILPPVIKATGDISVAPNGFGILSLSTSPDATLTITNVPAFTFLSPVSASASDIVILPQESDAGTYQITATAVNAQNLTTVQTITLTVTRTALYRIYVNFDGSTPASAPWNNTNNITPPAGMALANLTNDANTGSGVTMTLTSQFGGYYNQGAQTGNNSGVVPDNVLKDYYYFGIFGSAGDQYIKFSGLSPANQYRFKFIGSSTFTNNGTITDNGTTIYAIGSQSASCKVQNNSTQFAVIDNVTTNNVGEVTVHLSKGQNTAVGYINGLILEAYPVDPSHFTPTNLVASGFSRTQVNLSWSDNSPIELGYEIQRSVSGLDGTYAVINTTASDISSYVDAVPTGGALYYYRVRAVVQGGYSDFTNVATSGSVAFKIYVNVDAPNSAGQAVYDAPVPWNNLSRFGITGDIFTGFRDDTGLSTGLRMRIQTQLEGANDWGPTTTPANSGIFPDVVLKSFWFNDAYFPKGVFIIDGLDQTFSYNFGFLGSIVIGSPVNTDFTINGVTVTNKNDNNTATISYLRNVKPDGNGEIMFTVQETAGSPYSIWNALTIEGFASATTAPGGRVALANQSARVDGNIKQVRYGEATNVMSVYPNPVKDQMNVKVEDTSIGAFSYVFYDMMGREVQKGQITNDDIEANFQIGIDLPAAVYLMKVIYPDGRMESRRFIKE